VVRNGVAQPRKVTTAAGELEIQAPRVNDRREGCRFTSKILPPWAMRSPKVTEVLPVLYLRGITTKDFVPRWPSLSAVDKIAPRRGPVGGTEVPCPRSLCRCSVTLPETCVSRIGEAQRGGRAMWWTAARSPPVGMYKHPRSFLPRRRRRDAPRAGWGASARRVTPRRRHMELEEV